MAQRPSYAGSSPKGYPELASRFRDDDTVNINNRVGETTPEVNPNLPTDARGDADLVKRVSEWPRENQPFWFINAQHIEQHRRPNENVIGQRGIQSSTTSTITNQQNSASGLQATNFQSRFGGSENTETRTVKPLSQRGSFAGSGRRN
ncbi:hypothetical protein GWI33_017445 [Rhynchophorus ferrugineus]|uniref:Uncharacterized protein n=1 Tax=Rhynchophorus ferrugineus TaxID=354439 RepID=A0A834HY94_RHYFE|nr:hypothetical protein GWI33_017445 [Rhynchophorus ferrugineus]